jgi:hypothetical protein
MTKRNELRKAAMAAHDNAQRFAWRINNASRTNSWSVDLHGLGVPHAIAKFEKQFRCLQGMEHPGGIVMHVCVGKGLHSEGNVPKIKEQVSVCVWGAVGGVAVSRGGARSRPKNACRALCLKRRGLCAGGLHELRGAG